MSYVIGADYGTASGRVVVIEAATGAPLGRAVVPYANGVIDQRLPSSNEALGVDWALQDPDDWIQVLTRGVPEAVAEAGVAPSEIVGIGVDFTSCTVLPVLADGTPLCTVEGWRRRPHAWPKLWKHHSAQHVADRLNEVALERGESFLSRYGGRISSEWYFPKLIELWLEDREAYDAADRFLEATDWIVWWLCGAEVRQSSTAGYKALWSPDEGLPDIDYFTAAYPGFDRPAAKLGERFVPLGTRAGALRDDVASRLGLTGGGAVSVAVGNVDAFSSVPGCGVEQPGVFVTVVGTSICDMVVSPREVRLPGITGVVRDGILPGLYGYEAGQAAVGDMLGWYVETLGAGAGAGFAALEAGAGALAPGAHGLVALDWFNGNRTILADAGLTGVLFGLTLHSTPAEIYRALLESIAFGNRTIVENFVAHGLPIDSIVACGGIAERSPLLMQLFADVSGVSVSVPAAEEIPARGAALFGAVAAGCFADIGAAVAATRPATARTYVPDAGARARYDRLFAAYTELHDLFGRERTALMYGLKRLRAEVTGSE